MAWRKEREESEGYGVVVVVGRTRPLRLPSSLLPLFPHKNDSYIHSSTALPDFNFAINQQNKQTSGRKGEKSEGWMGGWCGGCKG